MSTDVNGEDRGMMSSIRNLGSTTIACFQNRLELFSVELKEQKVQLLTLLIWAGLAVFMAVLTLVLITATAIYLFPPEWRVYAFGGFSLLYLTATLVIVGKIRNNLKEGPQPFSDTIGELKKDREWLKNLK